MTHADLEAAAAEKYPFMQGYGRTFNRVQQKLRSAYVQGRLDQAEADARIAEACSEEAQARRVGSNPESWIGMQWNGMHHGAADVAIRIRKGVE